MIWVPTFPGQASRLPGAGRGPAPPAGKQRRPGAAYPASAAARGSRRSAAGGQQVQVGGGTSQVAVLDGGEQTVRLSHFCPPIFWEFGVMAGTDHWPRRDLRVEILRQTKGSLRCPEPDRLVAVQRGQRPLCSSGRVEYHAIGSFRCRNLVPHAASGVDVCKSCQSSARTNQVWASP